MGESEGFLGEAVALAIDIGGTKLAAALVESTGEIHGFATARTPAHGDAAQMWGALQALIDPLLARTTPDVVGVGCGGPMSAFGEHVSPLNIPAWRDFPLRSALSGHTGLTVAVDNDAKALALGEGRWGAAVGVDDYLAMVVSTGVGGGIVCDGALLDGASGNAGHIGHMIVEPGGRACACGAFGCLEAEVSGTAIAAITGAPASDASIEMRERTGRLVGRAVASVAALLDLRLALVAGSVALGYGEVFFEAARTELERSARLSFVRGIEIRPAGLGDRGPILGSAAVGLAAIGC